jgi:hypothetical protein
LSLFELLAPILPLLGLIAAGIVLVYVCKRGWRQEAFNLLALALAALHIALCIKIEHGPKDGSWTWFPMFLLDFPASLVPLFVGGRLMSALVAFGIFGTIWWYTVGCSMGFVYRRYWSGRANF